MKKYVVIDANSSYFDENLQEFDYSRGFVVDANDQATARELAKIEGLDGLLFAAVAINQAQARDCFEHAPQHDGDCAVLIIDGYEVAAREPDEA